MPTFQPFRALRYAPGTSLDSVLAPPYDVLSPADVAALKTDGSLKLMDQAGLNIGYLAYNTMMKPFDDVRVRKALNMAMNKKAIIDAVFQGLLLPGLEGLAVGIPAGDGRPIGTAPFKLQCLAGSVAPYFSAEGFGQVTGFLFGHHARRLVYFPDTAARGKGDAMRPGQTVHPSQDGIDEGLVRLGASLLRMHAV